MQRVTRESKRARDKKETGPLSPTFFVRMCFDGVYGVVAAKDVWGKGLGDKRKWKCETGKW
jgi:hypothetical protein